MLHGVATGYGCAGLPAPPPRCGLVAAVCVRVGVRVRVCGFCEDALVTGRPVAAALSDLKWGHIVRSVSDRVLPVHSLRGDLNVII